MAMRLASLAVFLIVLGHGAAEGVQQVKSLYTAIEPNVCKALSDRNGSRRLCKGLPGYPVYVEQAGLRTFLSVGPDAEKRRAARQSLKVDNTLVEGDGRRSTVEWRFVIRNGKPVPYATIVRYVTHSAARNGEVLVVARVTERETCHVAYIDALATPDAIVLARRLADTVARRSSSCPREAEVHGIAGRSPM